MNMPLFCFGSLMDREMLSCVLDRPIDNIELVSATIQGYSRVCLPHETYPMLVVDVEHDAPGMLVYGLCKSDLERIVFFEGDEYELSPCQVRLKDGSVAEALFFDEGTMPPAESTEWDFVHWQKEYKPYMLRQSKRYMSYFGHMSAAEADIHWQEYRED